MKPPELSAAEWEIMDVVWDFDGAVTVRQVLDTAYSQGEKAYTTVQTLMNILVEKRYLTRAKPEKINYYTPVPTREQALKDSLSGVAHRLFQGSMGAMASFLVGSVRLRPEELEALRQLLDTQEQDKA
jgi:BlaI family penicillinase repressor